MNPRRLAFAVLPVAAAASLGGLGARQAPTTYARLDKPRWSPPASVFGPVWAALYACIGAAGWRVYAGPPSARRLHLGQLTLNAAWPWIFFSARDKRGSLAVIALLVAAVAAEVAVLSREDRAAAALLAPYLGWIGFATALNAAVGQPPK